MARKKQSALGREQASKRQRKVGLRKRFEAGSTNPGDTWSSEANRSQVRPDQGAVPDPGERR
jgi:hypothetical protein